MTARPNWQRYLFPLVIVVLLIWLAVQTLGDESDKTGKLRFSEALTLVRQHAGDVRSVRFDSSKHEVELRLRSGTTTKTVYPVDQSAYELQQLLEDENVPFEAKRVGSSAWWSLVTSLLPFVLLFGFWIFLMRNVQHGRFGRGSS